MNGLALCSGIGCLDLGLRVATRGSYRVVCHVEREAHAAAALVARMDDEAMEPAPIWDDLESFDGRPWRGVVDLVTAGLPCQPYSLAGARKGDDDERAIWPQFVRIVREVEPAAIFLENVPKFLNYLGPVWRELRAMGFRFAPPMLQTASESGAIHIRQRLFVLAAHADRTSVWPKCWREGYWAGPAEPGSDDEPDTDAPSLGWRQGRAESARFTGRSDGDELCGVTADTACESPIEAELGEPRGRRRGGVGARDRLTADAYGDGLAVEWSGWVFDAERQTLRHDVDRCGPWCRTCRSPWATESPPVRVDHGPAARLVELRAVGNGVVPIMAAQAWRELNEHLYSEDSSNG